jgi:methylmalonyl-CoA mutase cobalamin-binding subunit
MPYYANVRITSTGQLTSTQRGSVQVTASTEQAIRTPIASSRSMSVRRPRRSLVVLAAGGSVGDAAITRLTATLAELGIEAMYLGREPNARRIAAAAVDRCADAVELCLCGNGGVVILRDLLRELIELGRRDVSIVVHRVEPVGRRPLRLSRHSL